MVSQPLPGTAEAITLVAEINARHFELLLADVLPDVHLGPIREREDPDRLALVDLAIVEIPELGALVLRVPLAELVAEGEDALLGAGLLLVPPRAAEEGVTVPATEEPPVTFRA